MSIATALQNAQAKVAAAYSKCNDKGATMPATQDLSNLADCIDSISAGGGAININGQNITDVYETVVQVQGYRQTITINHNLGKTPKLMMALPEGDITGRSECFCGCFVLLGVTFPSPPVGMSTSPNKLGVFLRADSGTVSQRTFDEAITYDTTTLSFTAQLYQNTNIKMRFFIYA